MEGKTKDEKALSKWKSLSTEKRNEFQKSKVLASLVAKSSLERCSPEREMHDDFDLRRRTIVFGDLYWGPHILGSIICL